MIQFACAIALLFALPSFSQEFEVTPCDEFEPISYDVDAWEDLDTDYDQICEVAEYQKPSVFMVWLRSMGGAMYVGLCSAREYVVAKWYAMQKMLGLRKVKRISLNKPGRVEKNEIP